MVAQNLPWRSSANRIDRIQRDNRPTVAMMVKANMISLPPSNRLRQWRQ